MLYVCLAIYLMIALPLALLLYATMVAAKWGDNGRELETEMENEFQLLPQ